MKKQTAVLYARFSRGWPSADKCESVESQLEDLRRFCMTNNIWMANEFSDKALSANAECTGVWDAIHALKKGWLLIVRSFDRLPHDDVLLRVIRHKLDQNGCRIMSITEPDIVEDASEKRFVRNIIQRVSIYNMEITRARNRAKLRKRRFKSSRYCPYGWKPSKERDGTIVREPKERAVVDMIVMYYKQGKKRQQIADLLVKNGVRTRNGGKWDHTQISRILAREGFPRGHKISQEG